MHINEDITTTTTPLLNGAQSLVDSNLGCIRTAVNLERDFNEWTDQEIRDHISEYTKLSDPKAREVALYKHLYQKGLLSGEDRVSVQVFSIMAANPGLKDFNDMYCGYRVADGIFEQVYAKVNELAGQHNLPGYTKDIAGGVDLVLIGDQIIEDSQLYASLKAFKHEAEAAAQEIIIQGLATFTKQLESEPDTEENRKYKTNISALLRSAEQSNNVFKFSIGVANSEIDPNDLTTISTTIAKVDIANNIAEIRQQDSSSDVEFERVYFKYDPAYIIQDLLAVTREITEIYGNIAINQRAKVATIKPESGIDFPVLKKGFLLKMRHLAKSGRLENMPVLPEAECNRVYKLIEEIEEIRGLIVNLNEVTDLPQILVNMTRIIEREVELLALTRTANTPEYNASINRIWNYIRISKNLASLSPVTSEHLPAFWQKIIELNQLNQKANAKDATRDDLIAYARRTTELSEESPKSSKNCRLLSQLGFNRELIFPSKRSTQSPSVLKTLNTAISKFSALLSPKEPTPKDTASEIGKKVTRVMLLGDAMGLWIENAEALIDNNHGIFKSFLDTIAAVDPLKLQQSLYAKINDNTLNTEIIDEDFTDDDPLNSYLLNGRGTGEDQMESYALDETFDPGQRQIIDSIIEIQNVIDADPAGIYTPQKLEKITEILMQNVESAIEEEHEDEMKIDAALGTLANEFSDSEIAFDSELDEGIKSQSMTSKPSRVLVEIVNLLNNKDGIYKDGCQDPDFGNFDETIIGALNTATTRLKQYYARMAAALDATGVHSIGGDEFFIIVDVADRRHNTNSAIRDVVGTLKKVHSVPDSIQSRLGIIIEEEGETIRDILERETAISGPKRAQEIVNYVILRTMQLGLASHNKYKAMVAGETIEQQKRFGYYPEPILISDVYKEVKRYYAEAA